MRRYDECKSTQSMQHVLTPQYVATATAGAKTGLWTPPPANTRPAPDWGMTCEVCGVNNDKVWLLTDPFSVLMTHI